MRTETRSDINMLYGGYLKYRNSWWMSISISVLLNVPVQHLNNIVTEEAGKTRFLASKNNPTPNFEIIPK